VTVACDRYLSRFLELLDPEFAVGVGAFAEQRLGAVIESLNLSDPPKLGRILHPSPASPAANRDWAGTATKQLEALGVW
jgi:single-strand selective monofunctional uracil DNA glycosylase